MSATFPSVRGAPSEYRGPERRRLGRPWAGRRTPDATPAGEAGERLPRRVATGSAANIGRARTALHGLIGAAGWAVFAALWVWQLEVYVPAQWLGGTLLLVGIAAAYAVLTPVWVWWNRNIYRRRHRRRTALVREVGMERDALGRKLLVDRGVLLNPVEVRVTVDAGDAVKRYSIPPAPALALAAENSAPEPAGDRHEGALSA